MILNQLMKFLKLYEKSNACFPHYSNYNLRVYAIVTIPCLTYSYFRRWPLSRKIAVNNLNYLTSCSSRGSWPGQTIQYSCVVAMIESFKLATEKPLLQRDFDTGMYSSLTKVNMFMAKMKALAVITVHKAVHLRNLYLMNQEPEEPIRDYMLPDLQPLLSCDMTIKCQCNNINSYRDLVVHKLLMHGRIDQDIQLRVLSQNTTWWGAGVDHPV